jgi:hypothetical protein
MKVIFTSGYTIGDDEITKEKGHRSDVIFIDNDGNNYEVNFVTTERLQSDLKYNISIGKNYFTDFSLVVLEEVTKDTILSSVQELIKMNFFKRFTPIEKVEYKPEWVVFSLD